MKPITCEFCGKHFHVKNSRVAKAKFCSRSCKGRHSSISQSGKSMPEGCRKDKSGPYTRCAPAKVCGHVTKKGRAYCPKCRHKNYSQIHYKECAECGKTMKLGPSEAKKYKCCSFECRNLQMSKRQKGSRSHLWRGGVTDSDRILRNSAEYDSWRRMVFERDGYTCVLCGSRGGRLTADHIKEWFLYPALRFDLDNGRTLCVNCHKKTDNFGGRAYAKMLRLSKNGAMQYRLI